LILIGILIP